MYESSVRPRPAPATGDVKQGMLINCAAYHGGCRVADIDLDQAHKADTSDGGFVWIGLHEPDEPLLRTVQQRFGLHDLAIEDALSAHQRPKLEIYGDTLFVVVRTASLQDRKIRCGETHIFAGRGYVVTVRHGSTTAYKEVRTRCEGAPKMLAMGEGFVVYSIMDFIVDNYFPVLQELESEVDALEDAIFSRTGPSPIRLASKLIRAGSSTPNACPDGASTSTARSTASANTEFMPGAIPSASDKLGGFAALSGWRKRGRYSSISSCSRPVR